MHVVTADTHYPWPVPEDVTTPFDGVDDRLRTFRHLDNCVREFVEAIEAHSGLGRGTLVVVLADHTNITFGEDPMERLRIPLIFHSRTIEESELGGPREAMASQEDVLPTILGLLRGRHPYAGLGRDLLGPEVPRGTISASRNTSLYFRDGFALRRRLQPATEELVTFVGGKLGTEDVSMVHPEVFERMKQEDFALYETARRLAKDRRVYPVR